MKTKNVFILLTIFLCFHVPGYAQAPANDECSNAISFVIGTNTCGASVNGSTQNATQSSNLPFPSCDYATGGYNDDIWYKFTAAQSGLVKFEFTNIAGGDPNRSLSIAIDSGVDCTNLTAIVCTQAVQNLGSLRVKQGTTYYLRLYSADADPAEYKSFSFCAYRISNDECSQAKSLTIGNILTREGYNEYGTTDGSTQSSTTPLPSCGGSGYSDDVWYKFTAAVSGNMHLRVQSFALVSVQLYSGNCSGLMALECVDGVSYYPSFININAVAGTEYYVRIFSTDPDPAVSAEFFIPLTH